MLAAVLLSLTLGGAAHALETAGLSAEAVTVIDRLGEGVRRERQGRKLLADCVHVPRRAARTREGGVEFRRDPPALVFDVAKLTHVSPWDFELDLARAASLAGQGLPMPLVESEERGVADALAFALEKAADDAAFAKKFRAARKAGAVTGLGRPKGRVDAVGYYAAKLDESVDAFAHAVESGETLDPEAVRYTALADFIDRYGPDYGGVSYAEGALFARAGDKRYSAALYRAALSAGTIGGLAKIREALGPLETQTLPELRRRLRKFK